MSADGYRRYAAYQPSGNLALGAVPADWQVSRIAHVFVKSNAGEVIDKSYWGDGSELLYTCNRTPMKSDFSVFPQWKRTVPNDLLLTRNGTPYVHKPTEGAIYSNVVQRITLAKEYSRDYLSYCLGNSALGMRGYGVSIESFNFDNWKSLRFTHPPLKEQTQIARFLDYETAKIDALIEKQQQLIALLKEKRQAVISHAVTKGLNPDAPMRASGVEWLGEVPTHWEVSRLKHISRVIDCRNKTPEYFDDGEYFVIRTTNVKEQELLLDDSALRTDQKNFDIWTQRGVPPVGSILFTREAPAGEVCLVPPDAKLCMGQRMMNFIPFSDSHVGYLFSYLLSDCLTRYIGSVSLGSTVSHLRVDQVENITVPVPPEGEAAAISAHVIAMRTKMRDLISVSERKIELLQERRAALISAAVTGKIDVRKWQSPDDN
ncbi:MAG: restriction endonuclease subunit S [Gammaproteobacteria bacterium]|nr:MAG: restriction endonuclease subunit S [Gammaproteobacteria bacterium]